MNNRYRSFPILSALLFSLVAASPLAAQTDATVTTSNPPAPALKSVASPAGGVKPASTAKHMGTYTVVKGDSWTSIAQKFNTTRKKLKALNNLTASTVKPGQVLLVPSRKSGKTSAVTTTAKTRPHHTYLMAQPVQDFDIPASTFGSCPVPQPDEDADAAAAAAAAAEKPAPIAKLVSPSELAAEPPPESPVPPAAVPTRPAIAPAPTFSTKHSPPAPASINAYPQLTASDNDWAARFLQQARALGDEGIEYDEDWRPPGESHAWTMDCSNTTRYLYKITTGIQLPRTASDQYYYLHLQGKAWDVPQGPSGWADTNYLRRNLKPGDLLFWENTYRPERQPPITHVMVFLGTNEQGQWIMAGSQTSRGGEHNRRNGGPDIYVFRPSQACGGYTTWLGLVHHQGRFCAFGRPLEADPAKLAMAAND